MGAEVGAAMLAETAGEAALAAEAGGAAGMAAGAEAAGIGALGSGAAGLAAGAEGLGALGAAGAGGVSSLPAAITSALPQTAALMPGVAADTAAFANVGAIPAAEAPLGYGQIGSDQIVQAFQNAPTSVQTAAMYGPGTQVAAAPGVGADSVMGDVLSKGARGIYDLGATDMSLGAAGEANAAATAMPTPSQMAGTAFDPNNLATINQGAGDLAARQSSSPFFNPLKSVYDVYKEQDPLTQGVAKYGSMGLGALQAAKYLNKQPGVAAPAPYSGPLSKFSYAPSTYTPYTYKPYAAGGPVEEMSRENALGANTGYPQADIQQGAYATPWQTPVSRNVVTGPSDANVDQMTGEERMAGGGIASLGGYSDGGRLLKGPGDGMSDNIPANIGGRQPARLADGEFVVPADVVSGLGNGSTDAGAKQLYKMLDKVRSARTGTKKQGREINPNKYTPA